MVMNDEVMVTVVKWKKGAPLGMFQDQGCLLCQWGAGGGGGGRLFQIRAVLGKMSFYGNLPSGRRRNTCVSMRVDVIRETDIDDFVFNLEKKKKHIVRDATFLRYVGYVWIAWQRHYY